MDQHQRRWNGLQEKTMGLFSLLTDIAAQDPNTKKPITIKRAIIAPLCSALVIPGLGQIINQELKKGACILGSVFILFIVGIMGLVQLVQSRANKADIPITPPEALTNGLSSGLPLSLWVIIWVFTALWIYSVLDAYMTGEKIDRALKGDSK